jgi:hypothetical protein
MDEQKVKRNKWSRKGLNARFSMGYDGVLNYVPADLLFGIRDASDLDTYERLVMLSMALFNVAQPKNTKLVRGKNRPHHIAPAPTDGWCPADQPDGGSLKFSNQDPHHPEIVKIRRGWVGNTFCAIPEPLTIKDLMALTGLSHKTIIGKSRSLEQKGYIRVVIDTLAGPELLSPSDPRREGVSKSGAKIRRVLFLPGRSIDPTRRFKTDRIWSVFESREKLNLTTTQFVMTLMSELRGEQQFQSIETWAKNVGVEHRTLKRNLRRLLNSGVVHREERGNRRLWRFELPVSHDVVWRDRGSPSGRTTPT